MCGFNAFGEQTVQEGCGHRIRTVAIAYAELAEQHFARAFPELDQRRVQTVEAVLEEDAEVAKLRLLVAERGNHAFVGPVPESALSEGVALAMFTGKQIRPYAPVALFTPRLVRGQCRALAAPVDEVLGAEAGQDC